MKKKNYTREDLKERIRNVLYLYGNRTNAQKADRITEAVIDDLSRAIATSRPIKFVHAFSITPKIRKGRGYPDPDNPGTVMHIADSVYFKVTGQSPMRATNRLRRAQKRGIR